MRPLQENGADSGRVVCQAQEREICQGRWISFAGFDCHCIDCLQVDVDALREIAEDSSVESVPTFALYRPNP